MRTNADPPDGLVPRQVTLHTPDRLTIADRLRCRASQDSKPIQQTTHFVDQARCEHPLDPRIDPPVQDVRGQPSTNTRQRSPGTPSSNCSC